MMKCDSSFLLIIVLVSLQRSTWGYMWPLVWSGPHPEPAQSQGTERNRGQRTHENRLNDTASQLLCERDKSCGKGFYCDFHYGGCRPHKTSGEPCRRDGHCSRGMHCRFGSCQTIVAEGMLGARCRSDKDCGERQCCAKQHGESICKARLQLGVKCYVPEGGVDYVIDSICPCEAGLVCRLTHQQRRTNGRRAFSSSYRSEHHHMRCQTV